MTDKDKIKFAIRYLKQGLKSKRTPPLYEELMNELGFEKKPKERKCVNCVNFAESYELCCYSLGDEDYDCRGRKYKPKKKEIKENDE